jgi:hypothetical protein
MYWLEGSLKARADGSDLRIYTLQDLDEYAHKSLVPILWCINEVILCKADAEKDHLLDHLGKAQVMLRRLKGFAKTLSTGNPHAEQFVPISLLGKFGLNGSKMIELLKTGENEKLKDLVHEMASHAHSHLSLMRKCPDSFVKLSKYSCERYLKTLENNNFSILSSKVQIIGSQRDGLLPIKLFIHK